MRHFSVYGPFAIEVTSAGSFQAVPSPEYDDIKDRSGCYVFGVRWGRSYKPIYVGMKRRNFHIEAFHEHKQDKLSSFRERGSRGTIVLMVVAPNTGRGRPSTASYGEIETFLIQSCKLVNPDLLNDRKMSDSKWEITGVTTAVRGRKAQPTAVFRSMLGQ